MKLHINFKRHNPDYNKEYAKEYPFLQDKGENPKFIWSNEFVIEDVDRISVINNGTFDIVATTDKNNEEVRATASNMTLLEAFKDDGLVGRFAVSKKILKNTYKNHNEKYDVTRFYFYIKSNEPYLCIGDSSFVSTKELPEAIASLYTSKK